MSDLDAALIAACRRREEWAFRRLVERYGQPVYALCVALARADGEDLAQETFLRVFRAIDTYDPSRPESLKSWILTIARRLCCDRARHVRRRIELPVSPPEARDPGASPEDRLVAAFLGERVYAALAALPDEQRSVVALREWEGLDYEEIAAIEGVPVGTVRSRLARARAALREALGGDVEVEEARTSRAATTPSG